MTGGKKSQGKRTGVNSRGVKSCIPGIIDILRAILAYNSAKYQHFSIRPGLFDKYHQIT